MKKCILLLCLMAGLYFALWFSLAFPYRFIPSDDMAYFFSTLDPIRSLQKESLPAALLSLLFFKKIWAFFSGDLVSALVFQTVLANSINIVLIGLLVFKITQKRLAALLSALLFGTAAWPVTYHFWYSYTVFATTLSLGITLLLLQAFLTTKKRDAFLVLAGLLSGLLFWSSSSSSVMIALFFFTIVYVFFSGPKKALGKAIVVYSLSFGSVFAIFLGTSIQLFIDHIYENIHTYHYTDALRKFHYIPKAPKFSFFYLLNDYNPALFSVFLLVSVGFFVVLGRERFRKSTQSMLPSRSKILLALIVVFWSHLILIDLLPTTKLGRTHFIIFPLTFIILAGMLEKLLAAIPRRFQRPGNVLLFFTAAIIILIDVRATSQTISVNTVTPEYLKARSSELLTLYSFNEDPHAPFMTTWLGRDIPIQKIGIHDFNSILLSKNPDDEIGVLIGPHGPKSGNSVLKRAYLEDFMLEDYQSAEFLTTYNNKKELPYFAYFPAFLFEEEICQALYFSGEIPSYHELSKNINLLTW